MIEQLNMKVQEMTLKSQQDAQDRDKIEALNKQLSILQEELRNKEIIM